MSTIRTASHAGSWYSNNAKDLAKTFSKWLSIAKLEDKFSGKKVKAIIGPHAGYSYCGLTEAHAYKYINPTNIKRVFILGPSHRLSMKGCAITTANFYETPFGNLRVAKDIVESLKKEKGKFYLLPVDDDEEEHSIEMHLPWIAYTFSNQRLNSSTDSDEEGHENDSDEEDQGMTPEIIPIVVGSLNPAMAKEYGEILSKYFEDESNFFVISSDFCHWGSRFNYTFYDENQGPIFKSIQALDKKGMVAMQSLDPTIYQKYQKEFENTICGRNAISILLNLIQNSSKKDKMKLEFVHYSQSSKANKSGDSSVSYGGGVLFQDE